MADRIEFFNPESFPPKHLHLLCFIEILQNLVLGDEVARNVHLQADIDDV